MEQSATIERQTSSATLGDYFSLIRPTQWIKNVVVLAGPAAGLKLSIAASAMNALVVFAAFCMISSATYVINDVLDRFADAKHPTKKNRPIPRGAISPASAVLLGIVLFAGSIAGAALLLDGYRVTIVLLLYFALTLSYSAALKRRVILDVTIVAIGFVLRAWAGSLAVGVETSEWLVACVFTLCLFMGFGKRRCELAMIGDVQEAGEYRKTLLRYTPALLTHLITVSAGIAVITFLLYTMDTGGPPSPFAKRHLFYTLPLVVYGIFRFAMLTELGVYSGPTELVLRDKPLLATILIWTAAAMIIVYETALFGPGGLETWFGSSGLALPRTGG